MSSLRDGLRGRCPACAANFEGRCRAYGDELKGHMGVLVESLRDDIRLLAEGVVSIDAKVESLRRT